MQTPRSPLVAGLCFLYTIQNLHYGLSYTDILVLLHLMLEAPKKIDRDRLSSIIPRDVTRISASLNLLKNFHLVEESWHEKRKVWELTEEGKALSDTIWNKYAVRFDAMKDIL